MSSVLLLAALLGIRDAHGAGLDLDAISDALSRAVRRDKPELAEAACRPEAWADPRLPVRDMIREGARGRLRMEEIERREAEDRAVLTFRRRNPFAFYDTVELYLERLDEGWTCAGWDHSAAHARAYLAGLAPARLGDPIDHPDLRDIGEDLLAFARRPDGPLPRHLSGGSTVVRAASWLRQLPGDPRLEVYALPTLDRAILVWALGEDVISLFLQRTGERWHAYHLANEPPSLAGATREAVVQTTRLPPVPRDGELAAARERVREILSRAPERGSALTELRSATPDAPGSPEVPEAPDEATAAPEPEEPEEPARRTLRPDVDLSVPSGSAEPNG